MSKHTSQKSRRMLHAAAAGALAALMLSVTAFGASWRELPRENNTYKKPTREGYTFEGWYLDEEYTIPFDMTGDNTGTSRLPSGDLTQDQLHAGGITVYAKWKQPPTILLPGKQFNVKLKKLSGQSPDYNTTNTTITSFQNAPSAPDVSTMTDANIISTADSAFPVYAWFDNGTIWWYSDADDVEMNADSQYMFNRCGGLISIDVSDFDTSNVTDMSYMFDDCSNLTNLDVSEFDTSNVTDMSYMFYDCSNLTSLDVSGFDTSNVTDVQRMFYYCSQLTNLDVRMWDTSKVTNVNALFYGCKALTNLNMSNFNTSEVTEMYEMFGQCESITRLDLSNFDTSKVTDMGEMFFGCKNLSSLDISSFSTSNVTKMHAMFHGCSKLTSLDVSSFDTSKVTTMTSMFRLCEALTSLDLSGWDTSKVWSMEETFRGCKNLSRIYASERWSLQSISRMTQSAFYDCTKLPNHKPGLYGSYIRYAYYGGNGKGYLTYKAAPATP